MMQTNGKLLHAILQGLYVYGGLTDDLAEAGIPADWPLTAEEIEGTLSGVADDDRVDQLWLAQVSKIARIAGLPPNDSRLERLGLLPGQIPK